eukprot:jgi/Phyca11/132648/e_gw1.197.4.1
MLGSLDCVHWKQKNCLVAWAGQYTGKEKKPTVELEVVVSRYLWFWRELFGIPGSRNDINVLDRSDLFSDLANASSPQCRFSCSGCCRGLRARRCKLLNELL